jgi:2-keto-3-deoxy-L-rhamnonate aldolase RhmA
MSNLPAEFRRRFSHGDKLLGSFIKTPTSHSTEILGGVGFDFVVIDQEHAPFDNSATDIALLAARAAGIAALVRVPDARPSHILRVLDDGAAGILVPHVDSPEKAREIVAAARYRGGVRGYSNSPRAGGYGQLTAWPHVDAADASVTVIAMIEDREALARVDEIVAVDGLHGVFIGRGDLTVALGAESSDAPPVRDATAAIAKAARGAGKSVCVMVAKPEDCGIYAAMGASAFIVSTDQQMLRQGALRARDQFRQLQLDSSAREA